MRGYIISLSMAALILQAALPHRPSAHAKPETSVAVPTGAIIPLELKNTVSSRTAFVEEAIYAETIFPVVVNERVMIPAHSYVRGEITEVIQPGRVAGKAKLGLRCDEIILPDGTTRHMSARVTELAGSRIEPAADDDAAGDQGDSASKDNSALVDASKLNQQSAIVDAGGVLDPSLTGAAEGVGGLVMTLATRGRTIVLRPGTTFELQLTQPLDLGRPGTAHETAKQDR